MAAGALSFFKHSHFKSFIHLNFKGRQLCPLDPSWSYCHTTSVSLKKCRQLQESNLISTIASIKYSCTIVSHVTFLFLAYKSDARGRACTFCWFSFMTNKFMDCEGHQTRLKGLFHFCCSQRAPISASNQAIATLYFFVWQFVMSPEWSDNSPGVNETSGVMSAWDCSLAPSWLS